jgi:hypothetical protein
MAHEPIEWGPMSMPIKLSDDLNLTSRVQHGVGEAGRTFFRRIDIPDAPALIPGAHVAPTRVDENFLLPGTSNPVELKPGPVSAEGDTHMAESYPKDTIDALLGAMKAEVKGDVAALEGRIKTELATQVGMLRTDMATQAGTLGTAVADVKTTMATELGALRTSLANDLGDIRTSISGFQGKLVGIGIAVGVATPIVTALAVFALNRMFPAH